MNSPGQLLARAFSCDLRSLALFRIALGLLLIADLAWRLPLLASLFSEDGAWPVEAAIAEVPGSLSLYYLIASPAWTWSLLAVSALSAIALIVGWKTRLFTIVSWVLLISLQQRNTLVLNGGDTMLHLLLFWGMLLPLGARFSLDSRRTANPTAPAHTSVATAGLLCQVALIYIFNAIYKTSPSWRVTGEAVAESFRLETYTTSFAQWLLAWPGLLRIATHGALLLEFLGPFLAFVPWRQGVFRTLTALAFISFHATLLLTLRIGLFPIIGIVAWLPFLPAAFWEKFLPSAPLDAPPLRARLPVQIFAGILLTYLITWNVRGYFQRPPSPFRIPAKYLRMPQKWALFAPRPTLQEGRMVAVIETSEGIGYDAFTGAIVNWKRPQNLGHAIPSAQWRKYLASIRDTRRPKRAILLADWLRRDWERRHPAHTVQRVRLHYLWESTLKRQSPPDNWLIYENPPGPIGEMARAAGAQPIPPVDRSDN